jgi:hypothetical protein
MGQTGPESINMKDGGNSWYDRMRASLAHEDIMSSSELTIDGVQSTHDVLDIRCYCY